MVTIPHYHRYLGQTLDIVDGERVGAWGWGAHQGYNTLKVLQEDQEHQLSCVAAIGPVTAWESYGGWWWRGGGGV